MKYSDFHHWLLHRVPFFVHVFYIVTKVWLPVWLTTYISVKLQRQLLLSFKRVVNVLFQAEEVKVESIEAYENELAQSASLSDESEKPVRVNVLSSFIDGVLGSKRVGDQEVYEEAGPAKRPQVSVRVRSDAPVSFEAEQKIAPIIKSEIQGWFESGKAVKPVEIPEHEIFVHISEDTKREASEVALAPWGAEVVKKDVTITSLGPFVSKDIEVETALQTETTQPSPPDQAQIMRKRIWKTTTRETTTSIKQETRTEVEMLVPEKPEMTSNLYVFGALPPSENLTVEVRSKKTVESTPDTMEMTSTKEIDRVEREMQAANESICRKIEESLASTRRM